MPGGQAKCIRVAVGVIRQANQILLSKRHADAHQGGLWEFPGGKCEPHETSKQALQRELKEELGIQITQHRPLIRISHAYPGRNVLLDVHLILSWQGEPHSLEGQPIEWVALHKLHEYAMPAADRPIVDAIRLPDRYAITPAQINNTATFLQDLQHALDSGLKLLQFRAFGLSDTAYKTTLEQAQAYCAGQHAQLMLNGDPELARQMQIDGLHLNSRQLLACHQRPEGFAWVAASCHTRQDLQHAQMIGANFAVLSPVLPTQSHPDAEPLGWQRFAEMIGPVAMPVYALGGMRPDLMQTAWQSGAQGIAGIRGLWAG